MSDPTKDIDETTGVETAFDQILQFAAIKTDDNFVELDPGPFRPDPDQARRL